MRRAGLIGVVMAELLLVAAPAAAVCDYSPRYSGQYRSSALDVFVNGDDLWVADAYGALLYDRSVDPPALRSSIAIPGTTSRIIAAGEYAYAASGQAIYSIRKEGTRLVLSGSIDAGGTVNDLLAMPPYLFAATSTGLRELDLLVPDKPAMLGGKLPTTSGMAFSLAVKDEALYAADGDATVDVFTVQSPALPQPIGTFGSLPRTTSVRVLGDRLIASDGQQAEVFAGGGAAMARIGSAQGIGATALVPLDVTSGFMGGNGRQLRAVDFREAAVPVTLWEYSVPFSGGSINRITGLAAAQGRLYAAAGDVGLLTFDTSGFRAPYPVRAHRLGGQRSVFSFGNAVISAPESGGLRQYSQTDNGVLAFQREWDTQRTWSIHDGKSMRILASSGSALFFQDLVPSPPLVVSSASMRAPVRNAVLVGSSTAWVLLSDRSVWRLDVSQFSPTPVQVVVPGASPSFMARNGDAVALADLNAEGTTTIRYFAGGDLSASPAVAALSGAATSGIAVSPEGIVAAVTFAGVLAADFRSSPPLARTVSSVDPRPAVALHFTGGDLAVLRSGSIEIWDAGNGSLERELSIPGTAAALHSRPEEGSIISVATGDGIASVLYAATASVPLPVQSARAAENHYYRKMSEGDDGRLLFFDGAEIRVVTLGGDGLPLSGRRIVPTGTAVDFAAVGEIVYVLDGGGKITGYDGRGLAAVTYQLEEGADATPLALRAVRGALWAVVSKGCLSGACLKSTVILDPRGAAVVRTGELSGGLVDVDLSGTKGYALFDAPAEIRILDVSSPYAPAVSSSRASEGNPVSIAFWPSKSMIYTLGNKILGYTVPSLTRTFETLDDYSQDPSRRVAYPDQMLRVDGDCAVVSGRKYAPQIFSLAKDAWTAFTPLSFPEATTGVAVNDGRLYFFTEYSLEILSSLPSPTRRRAVR